jgi:DNA-binding MarR family transcriptional regulator
MTADPAEPKDTALLKEETEDEELEQRHLLGQLFAALTARYRNDHGNLNVGIKRQDLLEALHVNKSGLNRLLDLLRQQITTLGLELVEYRLGRETLYCIRTLYGVPGELTDPEYAVLGVIIATIEQASKKRRPHRIATKDLQTVLVARGRISRYQLDRILRRLIELGYITRTTRRIAYGPRLELEFDAERREAIANAATIYLAGAIAQSEGDTE